MNLKPFKKNGQWLLCDEQLTEDIETAWFDQTHWLNQGRLLGANSGRGSAWVIKSEWGKWVLRHYFRGGLYAKVSQDSYLWTGLNQCRAFAEFHLLNKLASLSLPAPRPVAARVIKKGLYYRNDLIMTHVPHEQTWAQSLADGTTESSTWADIGSTIARFHRNGVYHSDLNAHNILLNGEEVTLIDFDKCSIKSPNINWQKQNIERLRRSVEKITGQSCQDQLSQPWQQLLDAWSSERS